MMRDLCALSDLSEDGMAESKNGMRIGDKVIFRWRDAIFDLATDEHLEAPGKGCVSGFDVLVVGRGVLADIPEGAASGSRSAAEVPGRRRMGRHRRQWCGRPMHSEEK